MAIKIVLTKEEIEFFLKKIDTDKLAERISIVNNLQNIKELKRYLGISLLEELNERILKKAYKEKDIPNKILNDTEKRKLKELYKAEYKNSVQKSQNKIKKIDEYLEQKKEEIALVLKEAHTLIKSTKESEKITSKEKKRLVNIKNQIENLLKNKNDFVENSDKILLESISSRIDGIVARYIDKKKKEINRTGREYQLAKEYLERKEEIEKRREQELIDKINARKNPEQETNFSNTNNIKNEPVVIVAHSEDFCSDKSRFVLSVLHGSNIKISFYIGIIKLINEDNSFCEISFDVSKNIMNFVYKDSSIELDLASDDKIIDLLSNQTFSKDVLDKILDCLSVLYYVNTFYNEREKIEITQEENLLYKEESSSSIIKSKATVYLSNRQNIKIKTIRIKKGKRDIEGSFLTRGHWRNQRYSDGTKLI